MHILQRPSRPRGTHLGRRAVQPVFQVPPRSLCSGLSGRQRGRRRTGPATVAAGHHRLPFGTGTRRGRGITPPSATTVSATPRPTSAARWTSLRTDSSPASSRYRSTTSRSGHISPGRQAPPLATSWTVSTGHYTYAPRDTPALQDRPWGQSGPIPARRGKMAEPPTPPWPPICPAPSPCYTGYRRAASTGRGVWPFLPRCPLDQRGAPRWDRGRGRPLRRGHAPSRQPEAAGLCRFSKLSAVALKLLAVGREANGSGLQV
jgi:hypothetical protein